MSNSIDGMRLLCLGSLDCFPQKGNDSSNYLLDDQILIDTGWATVNNLLNNDVDLHKVKHIIISHFHPDHYLGLNAIFYYYLLKGWSLEELSIIGPEEDADKMVKRAVEYWIDDAGFKAEYPQIFKLKAGDEISLKTDTREYLLKSHRSIHPVSGLCYRITCNNTSIGFSGDTLYHCSLIDFFKGCKTIVHECTYGSSREQISQHGHSSAYNAGIVAREALVQHLVLVHSRHDPKECINAAREEYSGDIVFPSQGDCIHISF